jgi:hypothetical protein
MVPPIPWLINSGDADVIAAESQFMADYYLRAGIGQDKIKITGALSDDKLFQIRLERDRHRSELEERYGFLIKDKLILIGLPPDQFSAGKREGCEFDNYQDLIRFIVSIVTKLGGDHVTVLINLHPRIRRSDVDWLSSLGAFIVDESIEDLVPLSDIYIAVASATIRLAISCALPVVNFDAYQYDYDDYKKMAGVLEIKSKNDYEIFVSRLLNDDDFYFATKLLQEETASSLCLLDGKSGARILALFDRLIGEVG